ncbi:hypothetical protein HIM_03560 [Hirsutella minnesotensis 3608]|uniref:Zn(2)-C6 fungal-type domain-containing protein n=1 Tax=Hirsutella minnesotensis 3608 TaxID=1043627 RepID=A0A0F8A6K5_9HYPO|nr:hypothetical protein HIM_03560 [Hirsutella minnesotensis 3608]
MSPARSALQVLYHPLFQERIRRSLASQLSHSHRSPDSPDLSSPATTSIDTASSASAVQSRQCPPSGPGAISSGTSKSCVTDFVHGATHATPSDHISSIQAPGAEVSLNKTRLAAPTQSSVALFTESEVQPHPVSGFWQSYAGQPRFVPVTHAKWASPGQHLEVQRFGSDLAPSHIMGGGLHHPRDRPSRPDSPSSSHSEVLLPLDAPSNQLQRDDEGKDCLDRERSPPRSQSSLAEPVQATCGSSCNPSSAESWTVTTEFSHTGPFNIELNLDQGTEPIFKVAARKKKYSDTSSKPNKPEAPSAQLEPEKKEGADTRCKKSCLRCRIQKLRCVNDADDEQAECLPCQLFSKTSKKTIHRIACFRHKLIDTVLFRSGGLGLTERWGGTEMKNVSVCDRLAAHGKRSIHVTLGICEKPLVLEVIGFTTRHGDVTARYWYTREGDQGHEVRRKKEIEPFCLVNVHATADYFEQYVVDNAIPSILRENASAMQLLGLPPLDQDIIKRTYITAVKYYVQLETKVDGHSGSKVVNPEKDILRNLFILWFATRHTTGSAYICGEESLGMKPETKDETYPLYGKVSLPRMIVAQFDSINHNRVLTKYGRRVLQGLENLIFRNQSRWWWTIYLCVFILLREASFISADRYRHARNNCGARVGRHPSPQSALGGARLSGPASSGTGPPPFFSPFPLDMMVASAKYRYTIPSFVEELHQGCNSILMHWHYYNCRPWPDPREPWTRHRHFTADLTSEQHELVMETLTDPRLQRQLGVWKRYGGWALKYSDQLRSLGLHNTVQHNTVLYPHALPN